MLLCERFQERFCKLTAEGEPAKIDLNDVTEALGCGRRRLYDITIAYEAAEVRLVVGPRKQGEKTSHARCTYKSSCP